MIKLFGNTAKARIPARSTLPNLDDSLYPFPWQHITGQGCDNIGFESPQALLLAIINTEYSPNKQEFCQHLQANDVYQEWINATVFGRHIQRNFAAFYCQTEDSFNVDIPELFRHELKRYGQYLPVGQILFIAGQIPESARREKLFTTTINPATAMMAAQKINQDAIKKGRLNPQVLIMDQIRVIGRQVLGFPIRHNKRTSERTRNEVLILDFNDLRLVNEQSIERSNTDSSLLLRFYELR